VDTEGEEGVSETLLLHGECVKTMREFGDGTVDAVVCDPPYHLTSIVERFGSENAAPVKVPEGGTGVYARSTKGFMGQVWDGGDVAFRPETWREVLRVLKPGGYLLAFGATRGYHRMTCAIEDAGFEIRDCLSWQYGSGFPKSLSVSSAIDKAARGTPQGSTKGDPLKRGKGTLPPREVFAKGGKDGGATTGLTDDYDAYVPATDAARRWIGFGTSLKPAWEPIVVARKPLEGTVAGNVLKHGTGALNIDGCRVLTTDNLNGGAYAVNPMKRTVSVLNSRAGDENVFRRGGAGEFFQPEGRWPANLLLSCPVDCDGDTHAPGCPCAALDAQSGVRTSGDPRRSDGTRAAAGAGWGMGEVVTRGAIGDTGGASRYFNRLPIEAEDLVPFVYAAKASRSERNAGMPEGSTCTHPCVKPIAVMRHLVRLVTPPGGMVLDPFMGSGTTGIAALHEGFDFVGIEMNEEYLRIAEARIEHARKQSGAKG
jgi:site-specific DNA-methyltransferase (adenine-specific)